MPNEPIDWNRYEIRLPPAPPGNEPGKPEDEPAGSRPPSPSGRPEGTLARRGRPGRRFVFWLVVHAALIVGTAVGLSFLVEHVLYEPLWGPPPQPPHSLKEWEHWRLIMGRVALVLGGILGAGIARGVYAFVGRND